MDDTAEDPTGDDELGPVAVTLLVVGSSLSIAGLTTLVPRWALVVGLGTFLVGAAPVRAFWRRRRATSNPASDESAIADRSAPHEPPR